MQKIMSNIARTYTKAEVNVRLSFTTKFVVFVLQIIFLIRFKLKECHPRCVYQIYNRLIINNDSQKHNYICKYNNLPITCFGLIRPSSGWNTASEENYLFDLNVGGKGGTRSRLQIWG